MAKHTIVYIPGLGDHDMSRQLMALKLWRIYNVKTEVCPIYWLKDEPWDTKMQRILDKIDYHIQQGNTVSIVGISAGTTAALQAFDKRKSSINKLSLVCGKFQYPETVHPKRYKMNPCFHEALVKTKPVLDSLTDADKKKIRSYRPVYDNFLPPRETTLNGVKTVITPSITHVGGIAYALTLGSWQLVRFLKSQ
jgi:hypothetical protein